jgi:hypothetical protein
MRKGLLGVMTLLLLAGSGLGQDRPPAGEPVLPAPSEGATKGPAEGAAPAAPPPLPLPGPAPMPSCVPPEWLIPLSPGLFWDTVGYCGYPADFWFKSEFLLWGIKGTKLPPLVTTSSAGSAGLLGEPDTVVLFGGPAFEDKAFLGGRFTLGAWFNYPQSAGLEGSYFFLGEREVDFAAASDGSVVLARPFSSAADGAPAASLIGFPGLFSGNVRVVADTSFQGADGNILCNLHCGCRGRADWLLGVRYLELWENLEVAEAVTVDGTGGVLANHQLFTSDLFNARNRFYGAQIGLKGEWHRDRWFAAGSFKLALGVSNERVDVSGTTRVVPPAEAAFVVPGGLLALGTNSGRHQRDEFAVVPELVLNVGYHVTDHFRLFVGYTFIYWSDVLRAAEQVNLSINPALLPLGPGGAGVPAQPAFRFRETGFWAQGLNAGFEIKF